MKGYIANKILYIFPQEAAEIPYVDPSVTTIAIQHEQVSAFKEANPDYADLIQGYNYYTLTVNPKVWKGHTDDDIVVPTPQPVSPELAWSADSATVTIGADDNVFPTLSNPHSVTVEYTSSDTEKATIDSSTGEVTLVAAGDTTISAIFAGNDDYEAQTVTYTLTVQEAQAQTYTLSKSGEDFDTVVGEVLNNTTSETLTLPADVEAGDGIGVYENEGYSLDITNPTVELLVYTLNVNGTPYDTNEGPFTMPAENVELTVTPYEDPTSYDYEMYASNDPSDTTTIDTGSFDSYGISTCGDQIDGTNIDLVPCKVTSSLDPSQVDSIVYTNVDDMEYIDTTTRCKLYKYDDELGYVDTTYYVVVTTHVDE